MFRETLAVLRAYQEIKLKLGWSKLHVEAVAKMENRQISVFMLFRFTVDSFACQYCHRPPLLCGSSSL